MDQKTFQFHREKLSIFTLKLPVFCLNIQPVLFLIKTSKTRHCFHLDGLNFKKIENSFAFKCNSDHERPGTLSWHGLSTCRILAPSVRLWMSYSFPRCFGALGGHFCAKDLAEIIFCCLAGWLIFLLLLPSDGCFWFKPHADIFSTTFSVLLKTNYSIRQKIPAIYTAVQT